MADLLSGVASQSSLLLQHPKLGLSERTIPIRYSNNISFRTLVISSKKFITVAGVVSSDSKPTIPITNTVVDSAKDGIDIETEIGGGGGFRGQSFGSGGGGSGGGGGGGGGGGEGKSEGEGESSDESEKKKMAMSMSQKLTLGYAALVGVGGLMGYLKSGSQKSLFAGGLSASLLYYVYTELPTKPVLASSIGLGLSASLLGVMGSRFKKSGKVFPAGVVSLFSLVMTGGYLHGIMRSLH